MTGRRYEIDLGCRSVQTLNGHEGAAGMIREKVESKAVAWLAYQGELTQWSEPWEHFPSGR